jgi:hypothetical protein
MDASDRLTLNVEYYWPWMLGDLILIIVAVVTVGAWTVTFLRSRSARQEREQDATGEPHLSP